MTRTLKTLLAVAMVALAAQQASAIDDAHMDWWKNDRFGLFIHFGLYSMGARHEWVKTREQMSDAQYDEYFKRFDPDLFDARDWIRQAKAAGMKYAVITTKHHEGFCLFDSAFTDYKSTNTPFGRDIVREFVEACRAEGMKVGFYYSLIDWHHPQYTIDRWHPQRPGSFGTHDRKASKKVPEEKWTEVNKGRDFSIYRKYMYDQVTELLTKYGKIDLMWFDFTVVWDHSKSSADWKSDDLLALVRRLQPGIIVNNRLGIDGKKDYGDFITPEQKMQRKWPLREGKREPWEMCQTFSGSWGYYRDEKSWKSMHQIIELLVSCVANGGNMILNVGPTGRGDFDWRAQDRLAAMGKWMKANSRAVYGCTIAPDGFSAPAGTMLTYNPKTKRLYMHLFDYKGGKFQVPFLDKTSYAQFLHDGSELRRDKDALLLPKDKPSVEVPVIEFYPK